MSPPFAAHRVTVVLTPTTGLDDAASRATVLRATAGVLGVAPERLRIRHEDGGRPVLSGLGAGTHLSLSHGRGVAALAVTGLGPVGVDVEIERPVPAQRLADRWFTEDEADWLRSRGERQRIAAFLWLWTHKEAMGKAYGTGLARGGLARPAPLPGHWPPRSVRHPARLSPLPGRDPMAVAAPPAGHRVMLAVAALGRWVGGAPVDVYRVRRGPPPPGGALGGSRPGGGAVPGAERKGSTP
ncbi:4'-phosphopantetheinyl transferase family protein [Streptomyces sp. NPDC020965]|uniref:4'-phosphopantetheinyl transferase family protein n=1 Tax=Streptomyces sp. NPDC020965 TaxID=3365105 RepID=UPI00378D39C0